MVGDAVRVAKAEFDRMNARSFDYQAVKREADADKNLYEELVRKIREAGINAGFQNGSIRIADAARSTRKQTGQRNDANSDCSLASSTSG